MAEDTPRRPRFGGAEPPDLEAIRQSPRQHVDLETVEKLADYAMALELMLDRITRCPAKYL